MKIILFGGSGLLGKHLRQLDADLICPTHDELDITDLNLLRKYIDSINPDLIINAVAIIDNRLLESIPDKAILTNIIGSANVAIMCIEYPIRYVYISSDYVYHGDKGNYKETDEILPFNFYAWTKLGGECSAIGVKNHLIIRTSFGATKFAYKIAFTDKWSSKDYVDRIAPLILEAAQSPLVGILNIGTERKTIYSLASERNQVQPVRLSETSHSTPYDTSLNLQKWMDYKSTKPIAKPHTNCRCCGSDQLVKYLDLGLMPLANNLEITSLRAKEVEKFPLQVMFCQKCGLSQLSVVVDPVKMFSYYTYRSSVNGGYIRHCEQMAKEIVPKINDVQDLTFHIDIAGNDGALLMAFMEMQYLPSSYKPLNIDPASNLCAISEANGIPSLNDFWGIETANKVLKEHGKASLITATNVFAHVDDIHEFLSAVKITLAPEGILVIECPYLIDFIENFEFDTVYYEHLSYISILPVNRICDELGLKIISVTPQKIHGGTVRIQIAHSESERKVEDSAFEYCSLEASKGFSHIQTYKKWAKDVDHVIKSFGEELLKLKKEGYRIAAFAASAKGNTLLNSAKINTDIIEYICDQTPEKIGKFSPGTGIPIVHPQELQKNVPDYLVILSWNFGAEIIQKVKDLGFKGKFIIPIPEFTILD